MIAEQYEAQQPRAVIKTLKSGERVIVDPVRLILVSFGSRQQEEVLTQSGPYLYCHLHAILLLH
jgi:hypothetical protein